MSFCLFVGHGVTRLKCGGFIFAIRFNHTMADGFGLIQFMKAIAEIARGAFATSIFSVWQRTLLTSRDPPRITCHHHEYDQIAIAKAEARSIVLTNPRAEIKQKDKDLCDSERRNSPTSTCGSQ